MRKKKQKKSDWAIGGDGVKVIDNNVELALKRFKKMIKDSKKLMELSERQYYTKPSVKKRLEKKMAKVRERKRLQESQ